eukprot:TRINITY_DN63875_c0_g1_i1.p1 TRINITY_DN63875_c0_g1~~TRINITY_DN63875_c0_g1_i1.p1  ORF type:complete len:930 (+),score=157.53 TRINITY_DN63875_c0_g1_i1:122-2911(+)
MVEPLRITAPTGPRYPRPVRRILGRPSSSPESGAGTSMRAVIRNSIVTDRSEKDFSEGGSYAPSRSPRVRDGSHATAAACSGMEKEKVHACGKTQLPAEMWGNVAITLHPNQFMRLLVCRRNMVQKTERLRLWHFFCHFKGFARAWDSGSHPVSLPMCSAEVNWQLAYQQNAAAEVSETDNMSTWIRIGPEEVRLVIPEADTDRKEIFPDKVRECNFFPLCVLRRKLSRMLLFTHSAAVPFRLRELIAGRAGFLMLSTRCFADESPASAVVEWPLGLTTGGDPIWQYPPHGKAPEEPLSFSEVLPGKLGPLALGRRNGWLVELRCVAPQEANAAGTHVASSSSRWVHVAEDKPAADVTLRDLCQAVHAELVALGSQASHVWLACLEQPIRPTEEVELGFRLLRDLRWTQSECLTIHEVWVRTSPTDRWIDPEELSGTEPGQLSQGGPKPKLLALLQRDALRRPAKLCAHRAAQWSSASAEAAAALACVPSMVARGSSLRRGQAHTGMSAEECGIDGGQASASSSLSCKPRWKTTDQYGCDQVLHSRRLLYTTSGVRQFEFHPVREEIMLVGKKDGSAAIINYNKDCQTHSMFLDNYPILGLSWLNTQPQWAVVAASQSGSMRFLQYDEGRGGTMNNVELEPFVHLSSLSMNCTDDFFMTSGFCIDVGLYDVFTGKRMKTFRNLHQNFINILRFAHRTPHMFATASFDHTCKVWDLRDPNIHADKPAMCCSTDTMNVMCCFHPNDMQLLVSGVDEALKQFDLRMHSQGSKFPVPALNSNVNYRRSLYLAGGNVVATVATNESSLQFYGTEAPHRWMGTIDFRNVLLRPPQNQRRPAPRLAPRGGSLSAILAARRSSLNRAVPPAEQQEQVAAEDDGPRVEYLQSLRCHPSDPCLLGALVAASEPSPESYIAAIRLGEEDNTSESHPLCGG